MSWLERAAALHPERTAVEAPDGALTYAELLEAARGTEGTGTSVPPARPGLDFVVAFHAALLHGVPLLPVDPRWTEAERAARLAAAPDRPDAALILFTSGSTGEPKPVALTPANLLASALGSAAALGLDPAERWLSALPLTHVGGLSVLTRSAIYGTTAVLHERFDIAATNRALAEDAITLVSLVPTMLSRLLDAGLERPPALRWVLLGGAPASPSLIARAGTAGVPVVETYGMTEASSQIATGGLPIPGAAIELAPDGEIVVSGPMVAGGGPLATGDLGELDDAGRLRVTGRKADTIVTGGENVAPQEVESVLLAHPAIADAAVAGRPDPEWGEALVALVVPNNGGELPGDDELRWFCAERLARFKVPKAFVAVPELPRNAAGKLVRSRLAP